MSLDIVNFPQGSFEWQQSKLGVISASNIDKVLAKKGSATRNGYLCELVAQVATGEFPEVNAKAMEWGKLQEPNARRAYEELFETTVREVGFIYGKDRRVGCSPDFLAMGKLKGGEIKAPFSSRVHVEFLSMEKIKPEYIQQCQFSLWVTGFETWDFCSYDPRFKKNILKVHTLERDPEVMERFDNEVPEFLKEMDSILLKLSLNFGDQWL